MDQVKKDAIRIFFETVQKLQDEQIIRSSKYSGDIAEYICAELYGLTLSSNQREIGFDARDKNNIRYQIKLNGSKKTNQSIGDLTSYDNLLLLITRNSKLFDSRYENAFMLIYNIPASRLSGVFLAKKLLRSIAPDKILDRNLNLLSD